jgi:hypothetical protein
MIVHLWPKKCDQKTLKQLVSILMLNTIRIFHGLGKCLDQANLVKLFHEDFGVSFWLGKLQEEDSGSEGTMRENYFKTLYKIAPALVASMDNFLGICYFSLQCYAKSKSFDIVTMDKLIAQLYTLFAKSHDINQVDTAQKSLKWFVEITKMPIITKFKRSNCILWLDPACSLAEKLDDNESVLLLCRLLLSMLESNVHMDLDTLVRHTLKLSFRHIHCKMPLEKFGVLDSNIVYFLLSRLVKNLNRHIQPSFHEKLLRKPHQTMEKSEMAFACLRRYIDGLQGISHEKIQGLQSSLLLAEGMCEFLTVEFSSDLSSPFFKAFELARLLNSQTMYEQISTHLFNLGSFLYRDYGASEALKYLEKSYDAALHFDSEIGSLHRKLMAYLKCLMHTLDYESVCKVVREVFCRFGNTLEYWKPIVPLYVQANGKLCQDYIPLSSMSSSGSEREIFDEELHQLQLTSSSYSKHVQTQLLRDTVERSEFNEDTMRYAIMLCSLEPHTQSSDPAILDSSMISRFKPKTSLQYVWLGRLYFENGMNTTNETEAETSFRIAFEHFQTAVKDASIHKFGARNRNNGSIPVDHLEFLSMRC